MSEGKGSGELSSVQTVTPEAAGKPCDGEDFRSLVLRFFPVEREADIRTYSPLALAFLGDGVYSLAMRTLVVAKGNRQAEKLHRETSRLVCAGAQAAVGDALRDILTPEEYTIYKRGRNANPYHHAKNATAEEYLKATALEALCGYLYLRGETERMMALLREGLVRAGLL